MRKIFQIILFIFVAVTGYSQLPRHLTETYKSQCDSNKINYVDSLGNDIGSNKTKFIFNGINIIYLDQLYDDEFKNLLGGYPGVSFPIDSTRKYCIRCKEEAITIVDSIDINHDGVKELFLLRKWYCYASPANLGPYGERGQQLECSKYEVWDFKSKRKIFEVKNSLWHQIAVSTSVVKSFGCWIDVSINAFGSFILSNNKSCVDFWNMPELGTYIYDNETNAYKKE